MNAKIFIAMLLSVNISSLSAQQHAGCLNYTVLNETWRNVGQPRVWSACDRSVLQRGKWYRLMPPAGTRIPEQAPPIYSCGTDAPMWLNGVHPATVSSVPVEHTLCANWNGNTCLWSTYIQVALCSAGYFIYMTPFQPAPSCNLAWCAEPRVTINQSLVSESTHAGTTFSTVLRAVTTSETRQTIISPSTLSSNGPCSSYSVLNDSWRSVNAQPASILCDRDLLKGGTWYRLMPPAGIAIPETPPPVYSCGTHAPMWLNGLHPTSISGGPVERQLCAHWNGNPCQWSITLQVAMCSGGYYVYMAPINPVPGCSLAWCGVPSLIGSIVTTQQTGTTAASPETTVVSSTSASLVRNTTVRFNMTSLIESKYTTQPTRTTVASPLTTTIPSASTGAVASTTASISSSSVSSLNGNNLTLQPTRANTEQPVVTTMFSPSINMVASTTSSFNDSTGIGSTRTDFRTQRAPTSIESSIATTISPLSRSPVVFPPYESNGTPWRTTSTTLSAITATVTSTSNGIAYRTGSIFNSSAGNDSSFNNAISSSTNQASDDQRSDWTFAASRRNTDSVESATDGTLSPATSDGVTKKENIASTTITPAFRISTLECMKACSADLGCTQVCVRKAMRRGFIWKAIDKLLAEYALKKILRDK